MKTVLARWRTRGALLVGGEAYSRIAGEVDEMPEPQAKTLAATGMVEIIDDGIPTIAEVVDCDCEGNEE